MTPFRYASLPLFAAILFAIGCHAQQPAGPTPENPARSTSSLSLDLQRRVEVMLRQKANLPPETTVMVGDLTPSEFSGFDTLSVTVSNSGRVSKPILFLLSRDHKTLAQITKFDITEDPKRLVSAEGRPFRGGPASAPVTIVEFDDLECPYCARLHNAIFPDILQRYGDKVRIVYRDYPIEQHPWAERAAVDTNCLASLSNDAYWSAVDYIHAHVNEIGADPKDAKAEKTLARADEQLDTVTRQKAESSRLDMTKLNSCVSKQDTAAIAASRELGTKLGVEATPTLYINGDKIDGAVSLSFLYGIIDQALRVAGVTPPPAYVDPKPATPAPGASTGTAPTGR